MGLRILGSTLGGARQSLRAVTLGGIGSCKVGILSLAQQCFCARLF